ncbi:MAG TPA: class II fructose-bisphosphate aldolase [Candidatus Thermoplasmatota archaeon]|nr:class II fructose-bisphosphate aldolase [Candidatus Thermoplasmatota archaeon]
MIRFPRAMAELGQLTQGVLDVEGGHVRVRQPDALRGPFTDQLVRAAVFAPDEAVRERARWLVRAAAWQVGVRTSSIHHLYVARGQGDIPATFTVPALNLRGPAYDQARAAFRAANRLRVGTLIFELARSEVAYTGQRPGEYAAAITAGALREGFRGPLFLQGDHYQVSPSKYPKDPQGEVQSIQGLIEESLAAGYRNIDIDASTLVTLEPKDLREQQRLNGSITAQMTDHIRAREPAGVTVSVGGEIGEVGKHNSKPEELEAFVAEYRAHHKRAPGLSKISVNTGSSHGGVVLPDGAIAKVAIDFEALKALGEVARRHGAGGVVQHGASTLPEEAFHHFPEVGTLEVHLATGFQNLVFDHPALPGELRARMVAWTKEHCADERKPTDTEEQFLYKSRKKATGPHKAELWSLPEDARQRIIADLEARFALLFEKLRVTNTADLAAKWALQEPAQPSPTSTAGVLDEGMAGHEGE